MVNLLLRWKEYLSETHGGKISNCFTKDPIRDAIAYVYTGATSST